MSPDPPGLFAKGFAGLRWHRQLEGLKKLSCLFNDQGGCGGLSVLYESRHDFFFWVPCSVNVVEAAQRGLLSREYIHPAYLVETVAVSGIYQETRPGTLVGQFPRHRRTCWLYLVQ